MTKSQRITMLEERIDELQSNLERMRERLEYNEVRVERYFDSINESMKKLNCLVEELCHGKEQ